MAYDFKSAEEKTSEYWKKNKIFEKSVKDRPKNKQYVFYDGPPFATGLPHYGHILGLTSKDLFPRFWTMKGYRVERRWGWDCHGLPIENITEKDLGIKDKKEIEEMGIKKFNEACRSKVLFFANEWKKTVDRMGKWIDFDNSYKTMDTTYMETIWFLFKKLHDKGFIYEGKKVLLYCPRCQTPLSNAEIAMDQSYKTVTEKSATAKFKTKGEDNTYFLAWTTTPWTLIGNVALAINPGLKYAKIKLGNDFLILAKDRLQEIKDKYELIEEYPGKKLLGKEYEPLYHIPSDKKGHYIIDGGDAVTSEDGTGIVHMALYGEFDYEMIKKYDLPVIQHMGAHGTVEQGPEKLKGLWFKKADKQVLEDLEERQLLFEAKDYTHEYPFCYRCETPLFYNAVNSWFVDIQKIKSKLIERNEDINWHPSHIKHGRFGYILETAPDWSISRNRFWATAIPVWKCAKCREIEVIGSIEELRKKAIKLPKVIDLHKHVVDDIHLKCKCKGTMDRIPEVFDCWFESGSMPYASKHYPFENKAWFKDNFPADFVSEYIAQVRAWFYYMHVIGVLLFDKAPFKHIAVSGNVLAADGSKMSKSKKNFPDPDIIFDTYGADTLRFYLMASPLMKAQDLNFKEEGVKEVYRRVMVLLINIKQFYELFGENNASIDKKTSKNLLDRWIISKLHLLTKKVTNALENYDTILACSETTQFIEELSTWYVRRSRSRFKSDNKAAKKEAVETLACVLNTLAKLMAPITPFISEDIHQMLRLSNKKLTKSVHLEDWPSYDEKIIDEKLNEKMQQTKEAVSKALEVREQAKIPIRQPLQELKLGGVALEKDFLEIITEELNVKKITLSKSEDLTVELDTKLTDELIQEGNARDFIRKTNEYRKESKLTIQDRITLYIGSEEESLLNSLKKFEKEIKHAVHADKVVYEMQSGLKTKEITIGKSPIQVAIKPNK